MPELPEVETSCRGVRPYLVNQVIDKIEVRCPKLRCPIAPEIKACTEQRILSVNRRAKYLLLELPQNWIVIHLGMTGSLRILSQASAPQKHDHIDLILNNGMIMRYTDPRRFGAWLWCNDPSELPQLKQLGPEPLGEDFTAEYLLAQAQRRKIPVKSWIMQNPVVVGVGNIYASESLFMAKIHPLRLTNSLMLPECQRLVEAIQCVLTKSIEQGGTTLKDFLQSDGKPGYFAQQLQVYGRKQQACLDCGNMIQSQVIAQRNTYFCDHCQK